MWQSLYPEVVDIHAVLTLSGLATVTRHVLEVEADAICFVEHAPGQ